MEKKLSKVLDSTVYDPDNYFILEKTFFSCIICYDLSPNLSETKCCHSFICQQCVNSLPSKNCPYCKIKTEFKPSKLAQRIVNSSIMKCQKCGYMETYDKVIIHYKENHLKSEEDLQFLFENNKLLYESLAKNYALPSEKKYIFHSHSLTSGIFKENQQCRGGTFFENKNCLILNKKKPEPKVEEDHGFSLLQGEANESFDFKDYFKSKACMRCEKCDYTFCSNCINIRKSFMSSIHQHPLELVDRDNGWGCDARHLEKGCLMKINGGFASSGVTRFRCVDCDFDLCEKCMEYYRIN